MDVEDLAGLDSQLRFTNVKQNCGWGQGRGSSGPHRHHNPFPCLLVCIFFQQEICCRHCLCSSECKNVFFLWLLLRFFSFLLILSNLLMMCLGIDFCMFLVFGVEFWGSVCPQKKSQMEFLKNFLSIEHSENAAYENLRVTAKALFREKSISLHA